MRGGAFARILKGYLGLLKGAGFLAVLLAASAIFGFLVAWPLWRLATTSRAAYSWFALGAAAAGAVFLAVRAGLRRRPVEGPPSRRRRHPVARFFVGAASAVALIAGVSIVLLLAARGAVLAAIPALALLLLLAGYLAFGRASRGPR